MSKIVNEHATPEQRSAEYLSELLCGHVEKGDPVDVANFCMLLQQRGESIAAAPAQGQQVEWRTTAVMLEQANAGLAQLNGKLRAELSALKAQQVGQEPQRCQCCRYLVTESEHRGCLRAAAPQPAPAQDVAGLVEALRVADEYLSDNPFNEIGSRSILHRQMQDALAAHDKQSGEKKS